MKTQKLYNVRNSISTLKWAASLTPHHLVLDVQVQSEGRGAGSPTSSCWEEPGCLFFHLSACGNSLSKREIVCLSSSLFDCQAVAYILYTWRQNSWDPTSLRQMIWALEALRAIVLIWSSFPQQTVTVWTSLPIACAAKRSYLRSTAYLLPVLTKLSYNSFNCMLTV